MEGTREKEGYSHLNADFQRTARREKKALSEKNEDHGIWSHHFMAIDGGKVEKLTDFIFLGSKITAHGDYSDEIKRCMLPGGKAMVILDSVLKSRDITLPTKVHIVKTMVFPVVMYRCENWTIKKAECF